MRKNLLLAASLLFIVNLGWGQTQSRFNMNVGIDSISSNAGASDYVVKLTQKTYTEYIIDSLQQNDVLVDDNHNQYRVDSITVLVSQFQVLAYVTCIETVCSPPQNGNNFIREGLESRAWTNNILKIEDILGYGLTVTDSTRVIQDSILIHYTNGVESARDTVRGAAVNEGDPIYVADSVNLARLTDLTPITDSITVHRTDIDALQDTTTALRNDLTTAEGDIANVITTNNNQSDSLSIAFDSLAVQRTDIDENETNIIANDNDIQELFDSNTAQRTDINLALGDTDDTNELQTISLNTNDLTLNLGGGTVDLSTYLDNTDTQDLSLSGDTLYLVDGGFVILTPYLDNTDSQITFLLKIQTLKTHFKLYLTLPVQEAMTRLLYLMAVEQLLLLTIKERMTKLYL